MDLEILYLLTVTISSEPGNIISINGDTQFSVKNSILDLKLFFHVFENLNFQCSSKTHFLSHKFQDPSCRMCSYGPHGPFWFSVKKCRDIEKRYQTKEFWGKVTFWDYRENELIHWRYILKSSPMLGSTRRGFFVLKN